MVGIDILQPSSQECSQYGGMARVNSLLQIYFYVGFLL
jgi:hypothetical protein